MKSFVTGSRVYGTPRPDSDIDLVVLLSCPDLSRLIDAADNQDDLGSPGGEHYEDGRSLRFGTLNLLCVTDKKHFDVWAKGTEELYAKRPVTRDQAIMHLSKLRQENKISGW